jgi:TetR/AcrR family transcriptional regulator, transcriptional repressor for nem operon
MKVSRDEAAANRERIVEVASKLFRENGFDGVGVAGLMKEAGMTHGGFYGHFKSKGHLVEEACSRAIEHSWECWTKIADDARDDAFEALVKNYLAQKHLSSSGSGCLFAAVGGDVARRRKPVRRVFTDGFEKLIVILAKAAPGRTKAEKRKRAIAAFSEMVGAMVLARAVGEPTLATEILQVAMSDLTSKIAQG